MALVTEPINTSFSEIKILSCIDIGTFDMKAITAEVASYQGGSIGNGLNTEVTIFNRHIQKTIQ